MTTTFPVPFVPTAHLAPVRVLFLSHAGRMYGAERQLFDLVQGARTFGIVPIVGIPAGGELADALAHLGVATFRIPERNWSGRRARFLRRYLMTRIAASGFAKDVSRLGIDVVHSNSSVSALGAMTARELGLPHVWHFHEMRPDWIGPNRSWENGIVKRTVATTTRHVVVPSHDLARAIAGYVPESLVRIVPNGLLRPDERRPLQPLRRVDAIRLLTVGRPKNWNVAIDCLAMLKHVGREANLTFLGGRSAEVSGHVAYAGARGVADRVAFVERVDDPIPFYRDADALLHPSRYESFGRVLVEAMAVGLPVIASRVGGIPEIVKDGRSGWLVEVGDAKGMAEAVTRVVDDRAGTQRMRRVAANDAWDRFGVEPFAASLADLYRECVA